MLTGGAIGIAASIGFAVTNGIGVKSTTNDEAIPHSTTKILSENEGESEGWMHLVVHEGDGVFTYDFSVCSSSESSLSVEIVKSEGERRYVLQVRNEMKSSQSQCDSAVVLRGAATLPADVEQIVLQLNGVEVESLSMDQAGVSMVRISNPIAESEYKT